MPLNHAMAAFGLTGLLTVALTPIGFATTDAANLCLRAAEDAAERSGVPHDVLMAVAVVESGRDGRPWPWTVNLGGEGHWLATADAAESLVDEALTEGLTNIDLGCFQLNYRWHAQAFTSISDMLDPDRNAAYAAEYLAQQYARTGTWPAAAAAYHSATPEHADRYRVRFELAWDGLGGTADQPDLALIERVNGFPLLIAGQTGSRGSLVPATSGGLRLIGGP